MNIYIYSYINKMNGHRYIGKTNNIDRRKREHKSQANNIKSKYYTTLGASKIREYGYDNFDFEILEVANEENGSEREQYGIAYYNTYYGVGYNTTIGGETNTTELLLTEEDVLEIIDLLKNSTLTQEQIAIKYNVSNTLLSNINQGQKYTQSNEIYPIRKNYKTSLKEYNELITLLRTTNKTFKEIAAELDIAESSVKKINYGTMQYDKNMSYPIRKINSFNSVALHVIDLLLYSNKSKAQIARECDCSTTTVNRINNGDTHYNPEYSYPLRK